MIPFNNLKPALEPIRKDLLRAITTVLDSGCFVNGENVSSFEQEWADYCGQKYCIACASGTDALGAAAFASGASKLIVQANTLPNTAIGIQRGGVEVEIGDIDKSGFGADCQSIYVGLYGRNWPPQWGFSDALVDACQMHGYKPPSDVPMTYAWSFYPPKNLGGYGDGGAVTTNDSVKAHAARQWTREHTSRMDEVHAALLRVKLPHLDEWNAQRRELAEVYYENLGSMCVVKPNEGNHHLFPILCENREIVAAALWKHGVACKVHYPEPLNVHFGGAASLGSCPNAEYWCSHVLSLPMWPGLKPEHAGLVCDVVRKSCES